MRVKSFRLQDCKFGESGLHSDYASNIDIHADCRHWTILTLPSSYSISLSQILNEFGDNHSSSKKKTYSVMWETGKRRNSLNSKSYLLERKKSTNQICGEVNFKMGDLHALE